jgi:hypothetical protein
VFEFGESLVERPRDDILRSADSATSLSPGFRIFPRDSITTAWRLAGQLSLHNNARSESESVRTLSLSLCAHPDHTALTELYSPALSLCVVLEQLASIMFGASHHPRWHSVSVARLWPRLRAAHAAAGQHA